MKNFRTIESVVRKIYKANPILRDICRQRVTSIQNRVNGKVVINGRIKSK